jgi:hypothetical protein
MKYLRLWQQLVLGHQIIFLHLIFFKMIIHVSDINQLYAAVNDPANAAKKIVLAAGIYTLDAIPGRPNGGRLELQKDMELQGQPGDPESVIIDASKLLDGSFIPANNFPARTGAIRMGRGFNTIEWIKVIGTTTSKALSVIDSDLIWTGVSRIRIANCIVTAGRIGIDIRNIGAPSAGRIIEAELVDNELVGNLVSDPGTQQGQGIVIQNANGVSGAVIRATFNGNNVHGNIIGIRIFNNSNANGSQTNNNSIKITSHADRFNDNRLGIYMTGGLNRGVNATVNGNIISFEAHGTSIQNNQGIKTDPITFPCGIFLTGGTSALAGSETSDNKVEMKLTGCNVSGNQGKDIIAFGALSTTSTLAGTNNVVDIHLQGVSKKATADQTPSFPIEPAGTNTVNIFR